jgi:DNA-binding CsgD family transcriptional regulator
MHQDIPAQRRRTDAVSRHRSVVSDRRMCALLNLLAAGYTDTAAARRLGVSPRTITSMVRSLMDRLGADNRFQLGLVLGRIGALAAADQDTARGMAAASAHHVNGSTAPSRVPADLCANHSASGRCRWISRGPNVSTQERDRVW